MDRFRGLYRIYRIYRIFQGLQDEFYFLKKPVKSCKILSIL